MQSIHRKFVPGQDRYDNGSLLPPNPIVEPLLSKRYRDEDVFFAAWQQSVALLEPEWFGDGTFEGLQKATTKHDLAPRLDVIRAEFKNNSRGYQSHIGLLVSIYNYDVGEELLKVAGDGQANFLKHFVRLDEDRHALLRILIETYPGW